MGAAIGVMRGFLEISGELLRRLRFRGASLCFFDFLSRCLEGGVESIVGLDCGGGGVRGFFFFFSLSFSPGRRRWGYPMWRPGNIMHTCTHTHRSLHNTFGHLVGLLNEAHPRHFTTSIFSLGRTDTSLHSPTPPPHPQALRDIRNVCSLLLHWLVLPPLRTSPPPQPVLNFAAN